MNLYFVFACAVEEEVLVLCWILMNLYFSRIPSSPFLVLVLCWILMNLYCQAIKVNRDDVLVLCWIIKRHPLGCLFCYAGVSLLFDYRRTQAVKFADVENAALRNADYIVVACAV